MKCYTNIFAGYNLFLNIFRISIIFPAGEIPLYLPPGGKIKVYSTAENNWMKKNFEKNYVNKKFLLTWKNCATCCCTQKKFFCQQQH